MLRPPNDRRHSAGAGVFQGRQHGLNRISYCACTIPAIKECHRLRRLRIDDQRPGISSGAKTSAVDHHLVVKGDRKSCSAVTTRLIVNSNRSVNRLNRGACEPTGAAALATAIPIAAVASVPAGGAGSWFVPKSRIVPLESTAPDTTAASAASTPLVFNGAACVR